jgi:hypothetical protein
MLGGWRLSVGQLSFLLVLCGSWCSAAAADPVRFNEHIRPLLSDRCNACHGPDDKRREADLRLDTREGAVESGALVPGQPEESELWRRITSTDPDERMPPPHAKKPQFTANELALIKRWIEEGAEYEGHWSFLPLRDEPPPQVAGASHPIDAFVRAKLATSKVAPSPPADRATLIRRVTLVCCRRRRRSGSSSPMMIRRPTNGWSTGCWHRRSMASGGAATGSIRPAMRTRTGTPSTDRGRCGRTATG